jgi:uncharacterized membrane protein
MEKAMGKCGSESKKSDACCSDQKEPNAHETKHGVTSPAVEILKERFARGEIDKAEFEERRQVLVGG